MKVLRSALALAPLFVLGCSADDTVGVDTPELLLSTHGGGQVVASARGSGHYQNAGGPRTFSFNAIQHADGSVSGNAQFNNRIRNAGGNGLQFSVDIVCVNFVSENRAAVVGAVKHVNPASTNPLADVIQVGDLVAFVAEDNGEGNNADPDRTSGWAPEGFLPGFPPGPFADVICGGENDDYVNFLFNFAIEIEKGNIQVGAP